jgi:spermidine/putrescine transport system ATP-binding protein
MSEPASEDRAGAGTPSVEFDSVTKRFGDLVAVDDLSLSLREGEFFTLLGPSGCGKTTSLRMVAGFEQPTDGRVLIGGEDVADLPPYKRPTNTVFQSYALFPHMRVEDNVSFGLQRKGIEDSEIRRRVGEELERVGLATEAKRRPAQLSGGQQQRVALARALVNLPKVLLLDEPLGALDLKLRKSLQVELKGIQREVGITFLYVTHDQEEALTMSDRIGVMNRGRLEQVGEPEHVYEQPASTFVAGFIGVSNLLPGTVASTGTSGQIKLDSGVTVIAPTDGFATGERLYAVVRPEKLRIASGEEGPDGDEPAVDGRVESSLYLGTTTQLVVSLQDGSSLTVLVPNADEGERQGLPGGGAKVLLSWAPEHMHLVREADREPGDIGGVEARSEKAEARTA